MPRTAPDFLLLLCVLALASYACRAVGFWIMLFVTITPRVKAALRAAPIAVMVGVVLPTAIHGGVAEWCGLVVVAVAMRWSRSDLVAMLAGVFVVAVLRYALR